MGCASPNPFHWEDLAGRSVETVLKQPGVRLSQDGHSYEVKFLNALYLVDPLGRRIVEINPDPVRLPSEEFQILLIRYLVADYGGPIAGKGNKREGFAGRGYFLSGASRPSCQTDCRVVRRGSGRVSRSERRELGAAPSAHGDKGMTFFPFPEIPVTYVLWKEDEEFPASATVLFDKSIEKWLSLDMIFLVVLVVTERIVGRQ